MAAILLCDLCETHTPVMAAVEVDGGRLAPDGWYQVCRSCESAITSRDLTALVALTSDRPTVATRRAISAMLADLVAHAGRPVPLETAERRGYRRRTYQLAP